MNLRLRSSLLSCASAFSSASEIPYLIAPACFLILPASFNVMFTASSTMPSPLGVNAGEVCDELVHVGEYEFCRFA